MSSSQVENRVITPLPGYDPEIGRWLGCLEDCRSRTLANLNGLSQAALDWRPRPGANSIASLLYHIAAIEASYVFEDLLQNQPFPPELDRVLLYDVRTADGSLAQPEGESLESHLNRLAVCRHLLLEAYRSMSLADFRQPRHLPAYIISAEWILHHLMQHEGEHRGQIESLRDLALLALE
ncbi:MAG: DinB family protein [Anaerolineales bacterium]